MSDRQNFAGSSTRAGILPRRALLFTLPLIPAALLACTAGADEQTVTSEAAGRFEVTRTKEEWRSILTPHQFRVLREHDTERPGSSPLNDEHRAGTYHCAGCDLALYSSEKKFESGTGWPSFTAPLPNAIGTAIDRSLFAILTEVHCRRCGGHLGHVFDDGPPPTGKRYCMNGAAMIFKPKSSPARRPNQETATVTFAAGCFWCVEEAFDKIDGVLTTTSGYIGGRTVNPTYEQVSSGGTGHTEALQITYDASRVSYETLLRTFWDNVDPLDAGGQFCDRGSQYRSGIFYHSDEQRQQAEASKQRVAAQLGKPVVTEIASAGPFYKAEEYHQRYYEKNPVRYKFYKWNCGRAQRLEELWGDPGKP